MNERIYNELMQYKKNIFIHLEKVSQYPKDWNNTEATDIAAVFLNINWNLKRIINKSDNMRKEYLSLIPNFDEVKSLTKFITKKKFDESLSADVKYLCTKIISKLNKFEEEVTNLYNKNN